MKTVDGTQYTEIGGRVVHGDNYGKTLGFPTANLDRRDYNRRKLSFKFGIYAGWAEKVSANNERTSKYRAAIVIGPLDKKGLPKIEAHLIGFSGDLYGEYIHLYIHEYIRAFKKYKNVDELKRQIARDILQAKKLLR